EPAPVVDDSYVGLQLSERAEHLERRSQKLWMHAVHPLQDADVDAGRAVDARPLRIELPDISSAGDDEIDRMAVARERDCEQRVGCARSTGSGATQQLARDHRDAPMLGP